ncbi:MAG: SMI1/KNR4 family protein [Mycobacterium sp.]|nr:SMI1/KNR4 family protein [Mycobacterium sp.]
MTSDEVAVIAFRTWRREVDSEQWMPGPRLQVHLDDGRCEAPAQLSWSTEDGTQCALGFAPEMTGCYGHRRTADGEVMEVRGEYEESQNWPGDGQGARGYEFDTQLRDVGGWVPAGRLRVLVEDGGEAPTRWVAWHDRSGHASSVTLRMAGASGNADVNDLIIFVAANFLSDTGEVEGNLVNASGSKWFVSHSRAIVDFLLSQPIAVDRYVLTSANDAPDRDPAAWTLRGSVDGQKWQTLDTRTGQSFHDRHQSRMYRIAEPAACARYRLAITANNGSPHLQLESVRFLAGIGGFVGYRQRAGDGPAAYRGVRVGQPSLEVLGQVNAPRISPPVSTPITVAQWREYLRRYSAEVLASNELRDAVDEGRADWLTESRRAEQWLGFDPATEQEVAAAERRLGVRLPDTYRNFLLTSNGWNWIGLAGYPVDLRPVDQIGWFAELEGPLLEAWSGEGMEHFADELTRLSRCLLISHDKGGVGCHWLLHVDGAGPDREAIALEWFPGDGSDPFPHDNFAELATRSETDR